MNKRGFGTLADGREAALYTIGEGKIRAAVTDFGATLVSLWAPDSKGNLSDVVLGYDDCGGYEAGDAFFGATVGRNANRIKGASFLMGRTGCGSTPMKTRITFTAARMPGTSVCGLRKR